MTLAQLIAEVDQVKPNQFEKEIKTRWVSEIEQTVKERILDRAEESGNTGEAFRAYSYDEDQERELLIPDQYADVYIHYICAKIDYYNREFSGYNNAAALHEAVLDDFAAFWKRTHNPKSLPKMKGF